MNAERAPEGRRTDEPHFSGSTHTVHTTWTWASLAGLVAGVVVLGIGVILLDLVVAVVGGALLVAGGVGAWRSGLFWDLDTGSTPADLLDGEDRTVERPGSGTHQDDPATMQHARETTHDVQQRLADRRGTRLNLLPVGAVLVLLAGLWLAVAQWTVYPETPIGRVGTWRAMAGAIVLLLAGLWLWRWGHSLVATGLALLTGVAMVLAGLLAAHDSDVAVGSELTAGFVALVGAALTLDPRRRR